MVNINETYDVPVALIVYKRVDLTKKVFAAIREVRPAELYIISDGPKGRDDADAVRCVREYLDSHIDWPCNIHRDYAEKNLGPRYRMPSGMKWVFENVDRAVFIEDDIEAGPDFFWFCREMLERYKDDQRVMMISGMNFFPGDESFGDKDYCFAYFSHIWGWATWKRAFEGYDINIKSWPEVRKSGKIKDKFTRRGYNFFKWIFDDLQYQWYDQAWDYQWAYHRFINEGLGIIPRRNLVVNLGIADKDAIHPVESERVKDRVDGLIIENMTENLRHPDEIKCNKRYDEKYQNEYLQDGPGFINRVKLGIRTFLNHKAYLDICEMEKDKEYIEKILPSEKKLTREESLFNGGAIYRQISGKEMRKDAREYRKYRKNSEKEQK